MRDWGVAFSVELLKARRSRLPWITSLAFAIATAVCGLFMFILQDPDRARSLGLLGAKGQLAGATADWPGFLGLLAQATAVGGLLIFGLTTIWIFGREFSDHTAKDLLALPTPRRSIVAAKFAVAGTWSLALAVQTSVLGLAVGATLSMPGWSFHVAADGVLRLLLTAAMTAGLTTWFAVAASIGRGYLPAVGAMFLALFLAQIVAALGYGDTFPWSVPSLYAGLAGPDQTAPGPTGYTLLLLVTASGAITTAAWWRHADHTQ